jgi:hypothetical protein
MLPTVWICACRPDTRKRNRLVASGHHRKLEAGKQRTALREYINEAIGKTEGGLPG